MRVVAARSTSRDEVQYEVDVQPFSHSWFHLHDCQLGGSPRRSSAGLSGTLVTSPFKASNRDGQPGLLGTCFVKWIGGGRCRAIVRLIRSVGWC